MILPLARHRGLATFCAIAVAVVLTTQPVRPAHAADAAQSAHAAHSAQVAQAARAAQAAQAARAASEARATQSGRAVQAETGTDACSAFAGARQLSGADGVRPAAWSGGGLVVPACGPVPGTGSGTGSGTGGRDAPVYPYAGGLWTAGYQCVEFSERYLYLRYGVTMPVAADGDQVVAFYAAAFAALFMVIRNGTHGRAPAAGNVLSLSDQPEFDSAGGGHTAVVQSSSVDAAGDGTVTVVEENAAATGVEVLPVTDWTVSYPGYRYIEWLAAIRTATGA